jgi:hypothetical protein
MIINPWSLPTITNRVKNDELVGNAHPTKTIPFSLADQFDQLKIKEAKYE